MATHELILTHYTSTISFQKKYVFSLDLKIGSESL